MEMPREESLEALGQESSHVQKCQCGSRKSLISADGRRWGIWNLQHLLAAEKNHPDGLTRTVVPAALKRKQTLETVHSSFKYLVPSLQM